MPQFATAHVEVTPKDAFLSHSRCALKPDLVWRAIPFARRLGDGAWINAGAIGMLADDGTPRVWFAALTPLTNNLRIEILPLDYDHVAAAGAIRAARLPDGYAAALGSGIWPSCDMLPEAERARRGVQLAPVALGW